MDSNAKRESGDVKPGAHACRVEFMSCFLNASFIFSLFPLVPESTAETSLTPFTNYFHKSFVSPILLAERRKLAAKAASASVFVYCRVVWLSCAHCFEAFAPF